MLSGRCRGPMDSGWGRSFLHTDSGPHKQGFYDILYYLCVHLITIYIYIDIHTYIYIYMYT